MYVEYEDEMMKKYDIPEELLQIRDKQIAAARLREAYATNPDCYEAALEASIEEATAQRLFWAGLRALYPEFAGHTITFDNQEYKASIDDTPPEEAQLNDDGEGLVC